MSGFGRLPGWAASTDVFVGTSVTAGLAVFGLELRTATVAKTDAVPRAAEDDSRDGRLRILLVGCGCTTDVFVGASIDGGPCCLRAWGRSLADSPVPFGRDWRRSVRGRAGCGLELIGSVAVAGCSSSAVVLTGASACAPQQAFAADKRCRGSALTRTEGRDALAAETPVVMGTRDVEGIGSGRSRAVKSRRRWRSEGGGRVIVDPVGGDRNAVEGGAGRLAR